MKIAEPRQYYDKIARKFNIDPLCELELSGYQDSTSEIEKRIKIASCFVPEMEKVGSYNIRRDLATVIVMSLMPASAFDSKQEILEFLINNYGINPAIPWRHECLDDLYWSKSQFYHPILPSFMFANYRRPEHRLEDLREFLLALQLFKSKQVPAKFFLHIFQYYGFKTSEINIKTRDIEIIETLLPFYPKRIEEGNALLMEIYKKGKEQKGTILGNLMQKTGRNYRTVKNHMESLRAQHHLRTVTYLDHSVFNVVSVAVIYGDTKKWIVCPQNHSTVKLYGKTPVMLHRTSIPDDQVNNYYYFLKGKFNSPFQLYTVYATPIAHYNFSYLSRGQNKFIIDWNDVSKHFQKCEIEANGQEFEPVRAPRIKYDITTLKIASYLVTDAELADTFLSDRLGVNIKTISKRRKILEDHSIIFPYFYSVGCPELYILFVKTKEVGKINYVLELLSKFPFVYYYWLQNIKDRSDGQLLAFINLPSGSLPILKCINKYVQNLDYDIYFVKMRQYFPAITLYQMYNEEEKKFKIDFNKFNVINL